MIYLVTTGEYSDYSVNSAFSSLEAAEKVVELINQRDGWYTAEILPMKLYDSIDEYSNDLVYIGSISLDRDGIIIGENISSLHDYKIDDNQSAFGTVSGLNIRVINSNKEKVVKSLHEYAAFASEELKQGISEFDVAKLLNAKWSENAV